MRHQIGEIVGIDFMGEIVGINLNLKGDLEYRIEGQQGQIAWVNEDSISKTPEMLKMSPDMMEAISEHSRNH